MQRRQYAQGETGGDLGAAHGGGGGGGGGDSQYRPSGGGGGGGAAHGAAQPSAPARQPSSGGTNGAYNRIDPSQIPRPEAARRAQTWNTRANVGQCPPAATSAYLAEDDGNCSPRYMRLTLNQVVTTSDALSTSGVPFGVVVQPLADVPAAEGTVPVVDFGESGPVRCERCRAYVNPFFSFTAGGRSYRCNLCEHINATPMDYFCEIDHNGYRRDHQSRPELCRGVIDFAAPAEYQAREPQPPPLVCLVEASYASLSGGVFEAVTGCLAGLLPTLPPHTRLALVAFDDAVHFFSADGVGNIKQMTMPECATNGLKPRRGGEGPFDRHRTSLGRVPPHEPWPCATAQALAVCHRPCATSLCMPACLRACSDHLPHPAPMSRSTSEACLPLPPSELLLPLGESREYFEALLPALPGLLSHSRRTDTALGAAIEVRAQARRPTARPSSRPQRASVGRGGLAKVGVGEGGAWVHLRGLECVGSGGCAFCVAYGRPEDQENSEGQGAGTG